LIDADEIPDGIPMPGGWNPDAGRMESRCRADGIPMKGGWNPDAGRMESR
jgi:hypothetical protein